MIRTKDCTNAGFVNLSIYKDISDIFIYHQLMLSIGIIVSFRI